MSVSVGLFNGIPMMNRILLGICAMDYLGNDPNPNPDTPGLIFDGVRLLGTTTYLLTDRFLRLCMILW